MPVACSQTAISGQEGSVFFKPAGTSFCLLDFTDFSAGTSISVPGENDYRIGDPVEFTAEGTASLDSGLTEGTTYYVVARTDDSIGVSATAGGTAITLNGDGGTGTGDTPGAGNHISIAFAEFQSVCQVGEFSLELTREEIEVTTLPCGAGASSGTAPFKQYIPGYIESTGTLTVWFTPDQASLAKRLLQNSLRKKQDGAAVKLYVSAVAGAGGTIDDASSLYIEGPVTIFGYSLSVTPSEATSAEINFRLNEATNIFGLAVA